MRRKLVKQGPSSLTVSLPSHWVKTNKLQGGQDVALIVDQNKIVIAADTLEETDQHLTLDVRTLSDKMIGWILPAVHKKGYEEVRVICNPKQFPHIEKKTAANLIGFEIVQHTGDTVVIRFVTKIVPEELPALIRRTFLVTLSLAEEIAANPLKAKDLMVLEETNNRLTNYCERILVKNIAQEKNTVFQYLIVWLLEKIADGYRDASKTGRIQRDDAQVCLRMLKQFYELYYKYSYERHDLFTQELSEAVERFAAKGSDLSPVLVALQQTTGSLIALNTQ
jgi:phosphate uptake regulator